MNEKILKNFENVPIGNVFYKSDQIGNVLTNVFMYFFAALIELHSLIVIGARFQILAASLIKHCVCSFDWPSMISSGLFDDFRPILFIVSSLEAHFSGYASSCWDFQTSNNFVWAFIWFTDRILVSLKITFVLILSNKVEPCTNLANLFWVSCRHSSRVSTGSDSLTLTFPMSWNLSYCNEHLPIDQS